VYARSGIDWRRALTFGCLTSTSGDPMATKLDKSIKRELVHGDKTYTITIAPDGLKVVEKGKRNGKELSWASIISGDASLSEDLKLSVDASRPTR
jgi:hypothetical protein